VHTHTHTHTPLPNASFMYAFMTIIKSNQICK